MNLGVQTPGVSYPGLIVGSGHGEVAVIGEEQASKLQGESRTYIER